MTKMPEPVAYLRSDELRKLGEPYSDAPLNVRTDSMMLHAKGTAKAAEQYGFDVSVITTTQAEAYKDACVSEALRKAMKIVSDSIGGESNPFIEIRKLMPKEQS